MASIDYHQPFLLPSNRVWRTYLGGRLLDGIEGKGRPADSHFPEDWVGSATRAVNPGREHLADEGVGRAVACDGQTFSMADLYTQCPREALGPAHVEAFGPQPQLLVKLLDSAIRLHVQAHPSVAWARRHLGSDSGKTEAWWILGSREADPYVLLGFQRPPSPAAWRRMVAEQDIETMLACFDRVPVRVGDVLLIEGGVPHAIGPGLFMVEIQEPTDYVVRCEYAHGGVELPESARTMGLGLDRVLDMFDYSAYPAATVKERFGPRRRIVAQSDSGRETALLESPQTDRVDVRHVHVNGRTGLHLDGRFSVLIVLEGRGTLAADGATIDVQPWSRVLLPAVLETVTLSGTFEAARCLPPKPHDTKAEKDV
ncbi:MAG: class I mannose-6-phosphate isomerase [Planctomycetes bacterium]|nr:class I mannose-6-phosphate isomerase [Planctomycetota bacterium]